MLKSQRKLVEGSKKLRIIIWVAESFQWKFSYFAISILFDLPLRIKLNIFLNLNTFPHYNIYDEHDFFYFRQ